MLAPEASRCPTAGTLIARRPDPIGSKRRWETQHGRRVLWSLIPKYKQVSFPWTADNQDNLARSSAVRTAVVRGVLGCPAPRS
jgi:hypothetical protein